MLNFWRRAEDTASFPKLLYLCQLSLDFGAIDVLKRAIFADMNCRQRDIENVAF